MSLISRNSRVPRSVPAARIVFLTVGSLLVLTCCGGSTGPSGSKTAPAPGYGVDAGNEPDTGADAPIGPIAEVGAGSGLGGAAPRDPVPGNPAHPPPSGGTGNDGWGGSGGHPDTGKLPIGSIATPSNSR